jgi:plastocyanin
MKSFIILSLAAVLLATSGAAGAAETQQNTKTVRGCVVFNKRDILLRQMPGGQLYKLEGDTHNLEKALNHTVEVQGTERPGSGNKAAILKVESSKDLGECPNASRSLSLQNANTGGEPAVPVAGKTGIEGTAVPVTSSASVGQTTPPANENRRQLPSPPRPQPGQPPVPENAGQNPSQAEKMAVAASRAEIGTSEGTVGVQAQPGPGTVNSQNSGARPARVVQMGDNEFEPSRVTIAVGQAIEWKNNTGDPHTVTLAPDRALVPADAGLPAGAQPFDSGTVPAGMSYRHTFTTPGTYRYFCTLHEGNGMVGEVVVTSR